MSTAALGHNRLHIKGHGLAFEEVLRFRQRGSSGRGFRPTFGGVAGKSATPLPSFAIEAFRRRGSCSIRHGRLPTTIFASI